MLVTFAFTQPTPTTRNIPHHGSSLQLWCRSEQTSKASWLCWSSGWSVSTARLGNTACKWARERRQWSNDICWEEGETGRGLQLLPTLASVRCARICLTNQLQRMMWFMNQWGMFGLSFWSLTGPGACTQILWETIHSCPTRHLYKHTNL